jgi:HAD superfamily hydrolase (TIGR01509 family)
MPSAVIFDCDGVLVDSEALGIDIERRALAGIGLAYDYDEYLASFTGLADRDFVERVELECQRRGLSGRGDLLRTINDEKRHVFETDLRPIAGAIEFVQSLAQPKAVASSATHDELVRRLRDTGLAGLFSPHIYSTDLVVAGKPSPDIYLLAAEGLGCAPSGCLVLEDSVAGVRAAVAARMTVWGFAGGGHANAVLATRLRDAGAVRVVLDYAEVSRLLGAA